MKNDKPDYYQQERFEKAKDKVTGRKHNDKGIGTLSEKTVHAVLKYFYEPDEDYHEVALEGYFADIYNKNNGKGIIEIQTRSFDRLRDKLTVFLELYQVTVVYPMPYNKWIGWIDDETGEVSSLRKSPRHFTMYDAFFELYKIKGYLKHPNLRLELVLMDMEEYKRLNGWNVTRKRGAARIDRIPLGINKIIKIERLEDYMQFVPYELEDEFTSAQFAMAAKIPRQRAALVLNILYEVGTVERVGKSGRSYLYRLCM
ncbi:MAG: hypothetical protein Q4F11_04900 [Eubacteriales bacterium]|nr:hypothetical protein [Eubacteriales bacterium]